MVLNFVSFYLFISVLVTTFFSAFIRTRSQLAYVRVIFLLSLAIDFYMYGYAGEINAAGFEGMVFWNHVQYIGIPFVSALWLTIALIYTGHFYPIKWWKVLFVFGIPLFTFLFRMTNGWHHLYFTSLYVVNYGESLRLVHEKGPWYYVQAIHSMSMVTISAVFYLKDFIKNHKQDNQRVRYMLIASFIAVVGVLLNLLTHGNVNSVDYMVLFLPVAVFVVLLGILRYDFLQIKVLARETVFESSEDGMVLMDPDHKVLDFNKSAERFFNRHGIDIRIGKIDTENEKLLALFYSSRPVTWRDDLSKRIQYYEITSIDLPRGNGHYGTLKTIRNITEKQLLLDNLRHQATVDEMSGLLNRRAFMSLAKAAIELHDATKSEEAPRTQMFLLMMDIDFFKGINDTFGHIIGDRVIEEIGRLLKQEFRESDLVGRVGGEEFAVFMEVRSMKDVFNRAEAFRKAVEATKIRVGETDLSVTISIGISSARVDGVNNISDMMNRADHALYASKAGGRNQTRVLENPMELF